MMSTTKQEPITPHLSRPNGHSPAQWESPAVAYHFFNEEATRYDIYGAIRESYDGLLSMATDLMVWIEI